MREFGFELRLCAHLEDGHTILGRQLGGGVRRPGGRIIDVITVDPGATFDHRTAITPETIPDAAIRADVGAGHATYWKTAFEPVDIPVDRAGAIVERAVDIGFFERVRQNGREYIRQTVRYPSEWFGRIRAIENKPDLSQPGELVTQLRTDVALGLVDEVILTTGSYVTRAHLNRLPDEVGVWRFHNGQLEEIRPAVPLATGESGVEIVATRRGKTDIRIVSANEKTHRRRQLAEAAYGKGWRTFDYPACTHGHARAIADTGALPYCTYHDRLVNSASECGQSCAGFDPAEPVDIDLGKQREQSSPWVAEPDGYARTQSALDRFDHRRE